MTAPADNPRRYLRVQTGRRSPFLPASARRLVLFTTGAGLYWLLAAVVPPLAGANVMYVRPFFVGAAGYFLGVREGAAAGALAIVTHTALLNRMG